MVVDGSNLSPYPEPALAQQPSGGSCETSHARVEETGVIADVWLIMRLATGNMVNYGE